MSDLPSGAPASATGVDTLDLTVLAHRAQLLRTLAPGMIHQLANAWQSLKAVNKSPQALDQVATRLHRVQGVLSTFAGDLAVGEVLPGEQDAPVDRVLAEVDLWQSCQITLPRIPVVFERHPSLPAGHMRPDHLRDVLAALITNAKEAMIGQAAGEIHVWAAREAQTIVITVIDDGPGFDRRALARLYSPFNTTRTDGQHLGIGLSVAHQLLDRAGGDIRVFPSDARPHTRVEVTVPASADAARPGERSPGQLPV